MSIKFSDPLANTGPPYVLESLIGSLGEFDTMIVPSFVLESLIGSLGEFETMIVPSFVLESWIGSICEFETMIVPSFVLESWIGSIGEFETMSVPFVFEAAIGCLRRQDKKAMYLSDLRRFIVNDLC